MAHLVSIPITTNVVSTHMLKIYYKNASIMEHRALKLETQAGASHFTVV